MKKDDLLLILQKGILAPSADNLQPWKFKLFDNQIDLFLDYDHVKNFCDEGYLAPYLSAGAVIENMRVAANHFEYSLTASYLPKKNDPLQVATLNFSVGNQGSDPYYTALDTRMTNRKFYDMSRRIDVSTYGKLERIVKSEEGFKLLWIKKNDLSLAKLSQILGQADQLRFESKRLHQEFIETLRFNQDEVKKTQDGLDLRTLEAGPMGDLLFKLTSSWQRLKFLNSLGVSRLFNFYTQLQMSTSQAAGLMIAKSHEPIDYIRGGEVMERVWHEITLNGLSIQPMEALPIFLINLKLNGGRDFTQNQKRKLENLKREFFSLFEIDDQNGLILLFRIGYARPSSTRSLRRPLESFLI